MGLGRIALQLLAASFHQRVRPIIDFGATLLGTPVLQHHGALVVLVIDQLTVSRLMVGGFDPFPGYDTW